MTSFLPAYLSFQGATAECSWAASRLGDGRGSGKKRSQESFPRHEGRDGLREGQEAGCVRGQVSIKLPGWNVAIARPHDVRQ